MRYRTLLAIIALGLTSPAGWASPACDRAAQPPRSLQLYAGMEQPQSYPTDVRRLAVGNPEIADVELLGRREFLVTAKQPGVTGLKVWTRCSSEPDNLLVLVADSATLEAAGAYPAAAAQAQLSPQVQTDIRVVEVSRQQLKQAGNRLFLRAQDNNLVFGSPGAVAEVSGDTGGITDVLGSLTARADSFNIVYGLHGGGRSLIGMLNMLEGSGYAYTLAEPSLVALSGQRATFLAGGEFPIPVPARDGSVTIEYKEFGVRLALTPTVIDADRIALKVAPEVSELDFTAGVQSAGVNVPGLRVRRTETSIVLADGESFVISGLIGTQSQSQVDRFPGLGSLPILGAFFRSSRLEAEDRELIMVVTPRLVRPLQAGAPTPELPGERLRRYRPGFLEFLLHERGDFDARPSATQQGFSH